MAHKKIADQIKSEPLFFLRLLVKRILGVLFCFLLLFFRLAFGFLALFFH